jgi:hypothetical protein
MAGHRGRPCRADVPASARLELRLTPDERRRLQAAAALAGYQYVTDFVRTQLLVVVGELEELRLDRPRAAGNSRR